MPVLVCGPVTTGNLVAHYLLVSLVSDANDGVVFGTILPVTADVVMMSPLLLGSQTLTMFRTEPFFVSKTVEIPRAFATLKTKKLLAHVLESGNPGTETQSSGVQVCMRVPAAVQAMVFPLLPPTVAP